MIVNYRYVSPLVLIERAPFGRVIQSVLKRIFLLTRPKYLVASRMGALFLVDQKNIVDRWLLLKGEWEGRQIALFHKLVMEHKPAGARAVFLDIGAHSGLYSIVMSKRALFDEIVAFEPDCNTVLQLKTNLYINELANEVRLIEAAALNRADEVRFTHGVDRNRGVSRIDANGDAVVKTVTVDSVINHAGAFVAAKIDVEGFEGEVLEGMTTLIAMNAFILQVEIFPHNVQRIFDIVKKCGLHLSGRIENDYFFVKT
jgi:FkbM family methyltransferase